MTEETRTDAEILENAPVNIELAGRSYPFAEPGKRRGRGLLRSMLQIVEDFPGLGDIAEGAGDETEPEAEEDIKTPREPTTKEAAEMLGAVDAILDFLYQAIPAAGEDRKHIDDNAGEDEIGAAFEAVVEVVQRPFENSPETAEP